MSTLRYFSILTVVLLFAACEPPPEGQPERDDRRMAAPRQIQAGAFSDVVEEALPSIVFIQTEVRPPEELERLLPGLDIPDEPMPMGMGSGVIFRDDGYILTNNHVVQDADRVMVVLHDRRYFEAEVIGRDPSTEVAVVRIPANDLTPAPLGDSDVVRIGDWVLAMGSPLGLEFSVTAGIVSGTGRAVGIIGGQMQPGDADVPPMEHFIQTDAALSPGNSGGPLVNANGEVIGINTAIAAQPGVPSAIGFAIPSNMARDVAEQMIETGQVQRPFLGVGLMDVSPAHAREHGLERVIGAAVAQVQPGSPADDAGIAEDDVIIGIDDQRIQGTSDLQAELSRRQAGDTVELHVLRNGQETTVSVRLDAVTATVRTR